MNAAGQWLRGNLHTHTTCSDGKREPQRVIDDYAERDYDFSANGPHELHVNASQFIEPSMPRQRVINSALNSDPESFIVAASQLETVV